MPMLSSQPVLQLSQAEIHQEDHVILQGVNLELHAGDFMYLIGSTGSGKSSLLKTLYADLPLTQGEGNIAGFNLKNLKQSDIPMLRRSLGIVFQDFQLLMDRSIFHNLDALSNIPPWANPILLCIGMFPSFCLSAAALAVNDGLLALRIKHAL